MNKQRIKMLIEIASDFEEADAIISESCGLNTYDEKIKYLSEIFDCTIVDRLGGNDSKTDYIALLTAIVSNKWRSP